MHDCWKWPDLTYRTWMMAGEAAIVIGLRSWLIALGGARSRREVRRMIEEKVIANAAFGTALCLGRAGGTVPAIAERALGHYGRKVSANRRRLSKRV